MIFRRVFGATLLACLFFGSLSGPASATGLGTMPLGAATKQPFGHYSLCRRDPAQCRVEPGATAAPAALDLPLMRLVAGINRDVNRSIAPESDQTLYGVEERWTLPTLSRGDCEDYALLKRRRLHDAGVPYGDLLMTVVRKRDGTGHAVLTLRTQAGDFVLDNLDDRVRPWAEVPYRFIKRQSSADPARWVEIETDAEPIVSALSR